MKKRLQQSGLKASSCSALLALRYSGVWSCEKGFMVWVSEDQSALQVCGPEGEVIVLIQLQDRPRTPVWYSPESSFHPVDLSLQGLQ